MFFFPFLPTLLFHQKITSLLRTSTTYKFTKDAKLIPVRIKWVKEQEQKLYHALLVVASQKQNEIKTLIRKSLEESRDSLVEVAEKHKFSEEFEPGKTSRIQRRELEEIILKELNTIIAKKLVGSVDMLKETLIDTLCRTVETLEKDSPKSDTSSPESSLESSTSTLVTGFSAKHALSEIISAAYQIEISSRNTISLRALVMEQLKRLFVNFNSASENEDDWKRKIAIQMIEKISEEKLAKEVCLQFKASDFFHFCKKVTSYVMLAQILYIEPDKIISYLLKQFNYIIKREISASQGSFNSLFVSVFLNCGLSNFSLS